MKGFIEVTNIETSRKIIVSIDAIMSVSETEDGHAFIEVALIENCDSIGTTTKESYIDVVRLLIKNI